MTEKKIKIIALLPMKANSERVKGKNFKDFCGKPLFRWTLDVLLDIKEIDKIVINTDARKELNDCGLIESERLILRDRDQEICGDQVSMNAVIANDVSNLDADIYIMTHTTNPLISKETILKALSQFMRAYEMGMADSLFTVDKVQSRFYKEDGKPVNHDPKNLIPTQNLEPWFEENSNLYIFTKKSFSHTKARIGLKPIMFESPFFESIDIDTQDDWNFASVAALYLQDKLKGGV